MKVSRSWISVLLAVLYLSGCSLLDPSESLKQSDYEYTLAYCKREVETYSKQAIDFDELANAEDPGSVDGVPSSKPYPSLTTCMDTYYWPDNLDNIE